MIEPTPALITQFLERLGQRFEHPASFYLFGGSALILLGGPRNTGDVDFTFSAASERADEFRAAVQTLAAEMGLDLEESQPAEFIPLPTGIEERHRFLGRYGQVTAYVFDLYSVALMKIDRAFPTDMEDVHFLLRAGLIELKTLEQKLAEIIGRHEEKLKLQRNFAEMVRDL
jgi:hypothetical protein